MELQSSECLEPPCRSDASTHAPADHFWRWVVFALLLMTAWMGYVYRNGEQTRVLIHDCLDSNVPLCSVLTRSDVFFTGSDAVFQPLLGGLPRNCLPSELKFQDWPYRYMSAFGAFVLCEFLVRAAALLGMALLLKKHLLPNAPNLVICGASLCFALLPFYPCLGLTIAGQPLLLYAILNLRNRNFAVRNWLIVGLFPLFSSAVMVGFFLVPLLAAYVAYEGLIRRKATVPLALAWLLLTGGYAVAEHRLIEQVFATKGFVSHRVEFASQQQIPLDMAVKDGILHFINGQYHVASLQYPIIMLACVLAVVAWEFRMRLGRAKPAQSPPSDACPSENGSREALPLALLCICCGIISLFCGLYDSEVARRLIDAVGIQLLRAFQFQRIEGLLALCWGLAFAFALALLCRKSRVGLGVAVLLILSQASLAVRANYLVNCHQMFVGENEPRFRLNFAEFFSTPLFAEIKDYIGRPQSDYRVVSLGMYPSIPLYNGFQTIDGYVANYSLDYKHRFRKIIAGELEKDEDIRNYFDKWGCRCYLFCHELGKKYLYVKDYSPRRVRHLAIDTEALRQLGCDYILSAVEIGNAGQLDLKLEKIFERDDSPWRIYLYSTARNSPIPRK